jgi:protein phosphatase
VTRYLGIDERVDVEFFLVNFYPNDVLMLTSDGLTKVLDHDTLAASLQDHSSLQKVAEHLIHQANLAGAPDNISVALLKNTPQKGGQ